MRWLPLVLVLLATPAAADTSVNLAMDLGTVIGHGTLTERLDAERSVGVGLAVQHASWTAHGGLAVLDGADRTPDGSGVGGVGWSAGVRWHSIASDVGRSFVGLGVTRLALADQAMPYTRRGHAWGPKVTLGLDYMATIRHRTMGFALAASYQYLAAQFEDGGLARGGYAGVELSLVLLGAGTCKPRPGAYCNR